MRVFACRRHATGLLALVVLVLAGCGGGGAGVGAPSGSAQSPGSTTAAVVARTAAVGSGNVTFTVGIPSKRKAASLLTPKYISPSTQSLKIVTDGSAAVIVNLTPSSPNCEYNQALDAEVCTASLSVPAGNHVFTVSTYDAIAAGGNLLSTNTTGIVDVKSSGTTTVSLVLEGLVARVALSFPNAPTEGTPATLSLMTVLSDADGNIIVGPAAYDNPVTLTTTDAVNGPLSKTLLSSPADASGVAVKYSGADVASITYSATATGLSPTNVTNAILTPGKMATYTSLYSFAGGSNDGALPQAGLTDLNGELFGTTSQGGSGTCTYYNNDKGCGVVFKISPAGAESVVYRFVGGVTDGGNPNAPLLDVGGSLYGTTPLYGSSSGGCCGVAFAINPGGDEHILYRFQGGTADGSQASPGGLLDVNGELYGTTLNGGSSVSAGVVYALTLSGTETILYRFTGTDGDTGPALDGAKPGGGLLNVGGVLYGTTIAGGGSNAREEEGCGDGCGTIFTITTSGTYHQIYRSTNYFGGEDADGYNGNLTNVNGAFYGTAAGGASVGGSVFEVSSSGAERVIYSFAGGSDGSGPNQGLINVNGTLYGTTSAGGNGGCLLGSGCGTVFTITPTGTERVVYRFLGGSDGSSPNGNLVLLNGVLYGSTSAGGTHNLGTVFALKP